MAPMALSITPPTTPDISAQFQRVDTLHQRLKAEAARSQEFLARLKRGEELHSQSQNVTGSRSRSATEEDFPPPSSSIWKGSHPNGNGRSSEKNNINGHHSVKDGVCRCQHQQKMPPLSSNFPLLPNHVDEREVRDLEKRVRGLEGRVRGFEGMPPDREMALLEVERLRRELEGLARRREGLFGLMDEKSKAQNAIIKTKFEADQKVGKNYTNKAVGKAMGRGDGKKR